MGEAKRRKKLDPLYGKSKSKELAQTTAEVLLLAVLTGLDLWRKENPDVNWKDFFFTQISSLASSPDFEGFVVHNTEDCFIAITTLVFTVLVFNPPSSFTDKQAFHEFLINKVTDLTPEELADLLNSTREEKIFIRDCAMSLVPV